MSKKLWGVGLAIGTVLVLGSAAGYLLSSREDDSLTPIGFDGDGDPDDDVTNDEDIARMLAEDTSEGATD